MKLQIIYWSDNWIPRNVMLRPYGCWVTNPPLLVMDLIDHTAPRWDMERLLEVCLPTDIPSILNIPICTSEVEDS